MTRLSEILITILVLKWGCHVGLSSPVTISDDGGYSIVIAIHQNVPEDPELITNIKDLFTKASNFLYNATRRQVYFREVTISLPSTWTAKPQYLSTLQDNFEASHFRINEEYDDEPHTEQLEGCGRHGLPVQLSPSYLTNLDVTVAQFGIPERRIVHEWAHFRYGVYDEEVDRTSSSGKLNYMANGQWLPIVCSAGLSNTGYFQNEEDGSMCQPTSEDDKKCVFQIESDYVTSRSSIMYSTVYKTVDSFCDDTAELKHNAEAPNQQNKQCSGRSTWDVISSHQDFKNLNPSDVDTKPEFRIVRTVSGNGRTVLLLDISGSMEGRPIEMLHESATHVVLHKAPENSSLGIVAFGTRPRVLKQMTVVNEDARPNLASHLPRKADGGGTGIGRGLLSSLEVLRGTSSSPTEGAVIALITDGEETDEPTVEEVLPTLVSARVIVHVIAYGDKASILMEKLCSETGGRLSLFSNIHSIKADTTELVAKISEAVTLQSDVEFEPVKVISNDLSLTSHELVVTVTLDEELGRNTNFKLSGADLSQVEAKLTTPSKQVLDRHSEHYKKYQNREISFKFLEAESGLYNVTVFAYGSNREMKLSLDSEAKDPKKTPVRVKTWIGDSEAVFPVRPKIYAFVKKGKTPVLNANVTADIIGPDSKSTVELKDDGIFPDAQKDDGCYTGVVIQINGNHRYQVLAHIKNTKKSVLKKSKTVPLKIQKRDVNPVLGDSGIDNSEELKTEDDPEMIFERVADAGVFRVSGWSPDLGDLLPPARVTDLTVVSVHSDVVTLSWTSPGDDLTEGDAHSIELRGSTRFHDIFNNFQDQEAMDSVLVNGSLVPEPVGHIQVVRLLIFENLREFSDNSSSPGEISETFYFALRALDDAGNAAEISNIVYASFPRKTTTLPSTTPATTTARSTTKVPTTNQTMLSDVQGTPSAEMSQDDPKTISILGVVLGVLLLIAILLALVYCVIKQKVNYNAVPPQETQETA